jgi:putative transposase
MIYNQKIEVMFSKEDGLILDSQSKMCNWLYNQLLELCIDDYKKGGLLKLQSGRNLRNQVPKIKEDNPFLYSVHSSPLKNVALRLKTTYERFFKNLGGFPKFKSWKKKWFSLYYDEPNKGFKVNNKSLKISLGKKYYIYGTLKEKLKCNNIKTFRLIKEKNKFYAIFTVEDITPKVIEEPKSFISIDQNHKNLFVAIDNNGFTYEFEKLYQTKYFDKIIDELKAKRDLCNRKHKKRVSSNGSIYYVPNKRWVRLDNAIKCVENRRREQIKSILYSIAHFITDKYDHILIGDYTPSIDTAKYDKMHRSMLNQTNIGEFRNILKWVCTKKGKQFTIVNEKDTTKTCCVCGHKEKKTPDIREFTCSNCKTFILRDVNSAVNISKKEGKLIKSPVLDKIISYGCFDLNKYQLIVK